MYLTKGAPRALIDAFSAQNRGGDERSTSPYTQRSVRCNQGLGAVDISEPQTLLLELVGTDGNLFWKAQVKFSLMLFVRLSMEEMNGAVIALSNKSVPFCLSLITLLTRK